MSDDEKNFPGRTYDDAQCTLGEGPLWHPERAQLFWFDIIKMRLLSRTEAEGRKVWQFDEQISAAGWVDRETLLIASENSLSTLNLGSGAMEHLVDLESGNPATRSNDGRADPWGGFWIGTMGKASEQGLGAIYRMHGGELRRMFAPITVPNAICFTPDRRHAVFADTAERKAWKVALDEASGWPSGEPEPFIDFAARERNPDGAVFDAQGRFWCAEWGASRVSVYDGAGKPLFHVGFGAQHTSCPAFGGDGLSTLFVTSARQGLRPELIATQPQNGQTFAVDTDATGQAEHQVIL